MVGLHRTPEDVARWALDRELGPDPTPEELVAAAARSYHQLRAGLLVYLGPTGFDSLWARAMHLAHGAAPPPGPTAAPAPKVTLPPGVPTLVLDPDPVAARAALVTTFASFIALLFTLLGPSLGQRLLHQLWPALPLGAPGPHIGDPPR